MRAGISKAMQTDGAPVWANPGDAALLVTGTPEAIAALAAELNAQPAAAQAQRPTREDLEATPVGSIVHWRPMPDTIAAGEPAREYRKTHLANHAQDACWVSEDPRVHTVTTTSSVLARMGVAWGPLGDAS